MKIVWQRILLLTITGFLYLAVIFLSFQAYFSIRSYLNNLAATKVTPLKKEFLIFPSGTKYSMYFEPKPNSIEVNDYNWSSGSATYTINSDGLNERYNYNVKKPKNTYRIITLGDSFTFGHFVNTKNNWSELLENKLNMSFNCGSQLKFEVINLGVRGYDLDFAAERFKRRGIKYKPDLVIWFINDHNFYTVRELITRKEVQIASTLSQNDMQIYRKLGDYFPAAHQALEQTKNQYSMNQLIEQENEALYDLSYNYGGKLLLIDNHISASYVALLRILKSYRNAQTIIYSEIPELDKTYKGLFPDGHPSPLGHEIYANDIFQVLQKNIDCNSYK